MSLRSAFPVRMSYRVNVRSEPMLARTDGSAALKRTLVIVSVEVGKVRFEMGALLNRCQRARSQALTVIPTWFRPILVRCWTRSQTEDRYDDDLLN